MAETAPAGLPSKSDARSGLSVTAAAGSGEMHNKTGSDVFIAASTMAG